MPLRLSPRLSGALSPLLLAGAMSLPAVTGAFPDRDPAREWTVFPQEHESPAAWSQGSWEVDERGLGLLEDAERGVSPYWLAAAPEAQLADGLIRARVRHGSHADYTLLFRAHAPADAPEELESYGLSVEEDRVALYRWKRGYVHEMGVSQGVPGLRERAGTELVVMMIGPWLNAQVYDIDSLEPLASLSIHDRALAQGAVGMRAHGKQDPDTRLVSLSLAQLQEPEADPTEPWASRRLLGIEPTDRARLPVALMDEVVREADGLIWLATDRLGLELLRRAGVEPRSISADIPRWADDARYEAAMDQPPVETARGFALDRSYKDAEMVEAILRGYAERYPAICRLHTLGESHLGFPILALRITDNPDRDEDEPAVLLNGAHHGSELLSTEYALEAMRALLEGYGRDAAVSRRVDGLDIWIVPLVNPDGNWIYMRRSMANGRKNGRDNDGDGELFWYEGVDLNRNYPFLWGSLGEQGSRSWNIHWWYRGPEPGSEPETRAMMALADQQHFAAAISYHTAANKLLTPYSIDGADNPDPDQARPIAEELVEAMPRPRRGSKLRVVRNLYSVDGTDQDWHYFAHGTLAYLAEGTHHNPSRWSSALESIQAMQGLAPALLDRVLDGPRISGVTLDENGQPLTAVVSIDEIQTFEGERWTSRPRDGRFDRMMAGSGRFTVRATTDDGRSASATVRVKDAPVMVELVLRPVDAETPADGES
jgi:hypothetical protein